MPEVKDKDGKLIHVGDTVSGKVRGGKHAGEVEVVVTSQKEAAEKGVKHPPKVLIEDQHGAVSPLNIACSNDTGHHVSRNPESLVRGTDPKSAGTSI